jgi:beta-lactamase class A
MVPPGLLSRRATLLGVGALGACTLAPTRSDWSKQLAMVEASVGGRLGVSASDTGSAATLEHRPDERFAMCSTFKAALAGSVLAQVEQGRMSLEESVRFSEAELIDGPADRPRLARGSLSIEELCAAAVEVSSNTSANLLLARIGGPAGFTTFLRSIGDEATRLDRNEPTLNENLPGDPRDTTTPKAMRVTLGALLVGDRVLSVDHRDRLIGWMAASTTGLGRLRAGLPSDWRAGDKTGTGANGAANDIAIAWPPSRPPILISCYLDAPDATPKERDAVHAKVARIVAEAFA